MMAVLLHPAVSLRITHDDPMLVIVDDKGRKRRLYTDNRGSSVSVNAEMDQTVTTAGWEGRELIVESISDGRERIVRRYFMLPDGTSLSISTAIEREQAGKAATITMLYDRSGGSNGQ